MLTPAEQAGRAAAGLHAHWRAQCSYITGGEVAERSGLLVTATRLPDETLNVAFAPGPVTDPAGALDWCEGWFRARGLHPGIEVRVGAQPDLERLLAARGYVVVVRRPAMTLHPLVVPAVPHVADVARVTDEAGLRAFRSVQEEAFDLTPEVAEGFLPWRAVETPGIAFFVAYAADGTPCATAATSVSEHGAGVVGVATRPAYRRRGIGRAVTAAALAAGAEAGADLAWLYPTEMARTLYEGLGFAVLPDEAQVWVAPRAPAPSV